MGMILRLLFVLALVVAPVVMWATSTGCRRAWRPTSAATASPTAG